MESHQGMNPKNIILMVIVLSAVTATVFGLYNMVTGPEDEETEKVQTAEQSDEPETTTEAEEEDPEFKVIKLDAIKLDPPVVTVPSPEPIEGARRPAKAVPEEEEEEEEEEDTTWKDLETQRREALDKEASARIEQPCVGCDHDPLGLANNVNPDVYVNAAAGTYHMPGCEFVGPQMTSHMPAADASIKGHKPCDSCRPPR